MALTLDIVQASYPFIAYGTMIVFLVWAIYMFGETLDQVAGLRTLEKQIEKQVIGPKMSLALRRECTNRVRKLRNRLSLVENTAPVVGLAFTVGGISLGFRTAGANEELLSILPAAVGTTFLGALALIITNVAAHRLEYWLANIFALLTHQSNELITGSLTYENV